MAEAKQELLTAGKIAEKLGVPATKVKKAIETLNLQPDSKKGACSYFYADKTDLIKSAL